jgi:short-subunit dehydrogenase
MVYLNCASTVQLAKHVVRDMLARNGGKILFTASIAGEMVAPREAVYAATKAFVLSFSHSLRYELRDSGVSVTACNRDRPTLTSSIAPGWTIRKSVQRASQRAHPEMYQRPTCRVGSTSNGLNLMQAKNHLGIMNLGHSGRTGNNKRAAVRASEDDGKSSTAH